MCLYLLQGIQNLDNLRLGTRHGNQTFDIFGINPLQCNP